MTSRPRTTGHPNARRGMGFRVSEHAGHVIPALSLTQPWAWAILHAGKDVENRTWPTQYRGPLWLHAASSMSVQGYHDACSLIRDLAPGVYPEMPSRQEIVRSAFVGLTWVTGCDKNPAGPDEWFGDLFLAGNPWAFAGQEGWRLDTQRTWSLSEPLPASGALGLWRPTDEELAVLLARLPEDARLVLRATSTNQRQSRR